MKFQVAVKRRIGKSSNKDPLSIVAEWPVENARIEKSCGTGMQYKVCNGLHLLGKSHPDDYSVVPIHNKLPTVDDPRDARPGVKPSEYSGQRSLVFHWTILIVMMNRLLRTMGPC